MDYDGLWRKEHVDGTYGRGGTFTRSRFLRTIAREPFAQLEPSNYKVFRASAWLQIFN